MAVLMLVALASCSDSTAPPDTGPAVLRVVSPNGSEGAALLEIDGSGSAEGVDGAEVFATAAAGTTRVLVVREPAGELRLRFTPNARTRRGNARVLEVAGPDDALRASVAGYRVEVER